MDDADQQIAECLRELDRGDESAIGRLVPLLYEDLRALAGKIQGHRARHASLNPTALVHEAYARIASHAAAGFENRRHFMRVAALAMRQLLSDRAREQRALKRGGGAAKVTLHSALVLEGPAGLDVVALDEALSALAHAYPRQARVVELRFLAGLSVDETAEVLEVSTRTVIFDWQLARAWLKRALHESGAAD